MKRCLLVWTYPRGASSVDQSPLSQFRPNQRVNCQYTGAAGFRQAHLQKSNEGRPFNRNDTSGFFRAYTVLNLLEKHAHRFACCLRVGWPRKLARTCSGTVFVDRPPGFFVCLPTNQRRRYIPGFPILSFGLDISPWSLFRGPRPTLTVSAKPKGESPIYRRLLLYGLAQRPENITGAHRKRRRAAL
jgi:hypothetical protein